MHTKGGGGGGGGGDALLTLDVPVDYATGVHLVNSLEDVPGVVPDHVLCQTLLGYCPQGSLVAVLHEHVEFILEKELGGGGELGRGGGDESEGGRGRRDEEREGGMKRGKEG